MDPKVPQEYRNPLSTDWDCYKTELVSGFGDWDGDFLTEDDIENSVNVLGGLRLPSGDFTDSDQEVVDHLLETHSGCQPIMENTARAIPVRTPTEEDWLVASEGVDSEKIR
jgi:hypothetical protein